LQVAVQATTEGTRDLNLQVDLYHKPTNTKLATATQRIPQSSSVKGDILEIADGTAIPDLTINDNIAYLEQPCGVRPLSPLQGAQSFPQIIEYDLGSATGQVEVYFLPYTVPDRLVIMSNNSIVLDTGYVSQAPDSNKQINLDAALAQRGIASSPISKLAVGGIYTWEKTSSESKVYAIIYAPLGGTNWQFSISCPNGKAVRS